MHGASWDNWGFYAPAAGLDGPALTFPAARDTGSATRGAVLTAVLSQALAVADTSMGNVQAADRTRGGLRIERHTGHGAEFVDDSTTADVPEVGLRMRSDRHRLCGEVRGS